MEQNKASTKWETCWEGKFKLSGAFHIFVRGKFTKKISIFFYFSIHFSFSFSFSTNNNLKKGHFGSPLLHFCETFATDCPNFINLSSFYGLVFAATHKTFSSFARKIENEKLFSNCDLRDQFFPEREFSFPPQQTHWKLFMLHGKFIEENSPAYICVSLDSCAQLLPLSWLVLFSIIQQAFHFGTYANNGKSAVKFSIERNWLFPDSEKLLSSTHWNSQNENIILTTFNLSINWRIETWACLMNDGRDQMKFLSHDCCVANTFQSRHSIKKISFVIIS